MSNGLISRKDAIELITSLEIILGGKLIFHPEAKKSVIGCLNSLPALEEERAYRGHWIGLEYDGYADGCPVYDLWECSECGEEHKGEEDTLTFYCPNCGAKMEVK